MQEIYDGEYFVIFYLNAIGSKGVNIATARAGKITVGDYPLFQDDNGHYFEYEYGPESQRIYIENFI